MLRIEGRMNMAICYAAVIDDTAIEQIRRMCDHGLTEGSRIRIMPDVHAGNGCTIGTTMTITDRACPNIVGVDIGCGMLTVRLEERDIDLRAVDEACHSIPSGTEIWPEPIEDFDLSELYCRDALTMTSRLKASLGTLGGGNHFIEIDRSANGDCYLVIHSGSRSLGKQVAQYYQSMAIELHRGIDAHREKRAALIRSYKETGRQTEISEALRQLDKAYRSSETDVPEELCWLYGEPLEAYLHDVDICRRFAERSRELMAEQLLKRTGLTAADSFHTIHNYIDTGERILRKGAIAAHKGERVLIPINMRDGSVIAIGRGDPEWNYSAPHGAGRKQARGTLDMETYRREMEGIYTTSVSESTIDEAPMAYKSLKDIIGVIGDTVDVIEVMRPIFNFKATESAPPWAMG